MSVINTTTKMLCTILYILQAVFSTSEDDTVLCTAVDENLFLFVRKKTRKKAKRHVFYQENHSLLTFKCVCVDKLRNCKKTDELCLCYVHCDWCV